MECPEDIQETQPGCKHLYDTLDSCCMSSCKFPDVNDNEYDAEDDSLYCQMDGQTFYKGEIYYPDKYPCKKCICKGGLNGKHVTSYKKQIAHEQGPK
ncbi:unnamed protein product [Timema podura]|uniref:VWFC domain-containing protein n=1 Tax=Timema podura TaxID=61482 RepID=A0ABN7P0U2_TIMPD|nr:unnamed protein product [Timema podura]